jgi:hypothetical protein
MRFTPATTPDLGYLQVVLSEQKTSLRRQVGDLAASNAPDEVLLPLYTAIKQVEQAQKNIVKSYKLLLTLEQAQQKQLHEATPSIELPTHSFRLDVDEKVELEDVTEDEAREAYVRFDLNKHHVRLYSRPVTSTDPKGWETVDWNYDLDGLPTED